MGLRGSRYSRNPRTSTPDAARVSSMTSDPRCRARGARTSRTRCHGRRGIRRPSPPSPRGTEVRAGAVEDLSGPADGDASAVGLPAAVHVAVPNPSPLVLVPVLRQYAPLGVDFRGAEEVGDVQGVRKDVELGAGPFREGEGRFLCEESVGALVVEVVDDLHRGKSWPTRRDYDMGTPGRGGIGSAPRPPRTLRPAERWSAVNAVPASAERLTVVCDLDGTLVDSARIFPARSTPSLPNTMFRPLEEI